MFHAQFLNLNARIALEFRDLSQVGRVTTRLLKSYGGNIGIG